MSFGLSGSEEHSTMLNADVAVAYIDSYRGYAIDYNITALAPVSLFHYPTEIVLSYIAKDTKLPM